MRINEDFIEQGLTSDDIVSQQDDDIKRDAPLLLHIFVNRLPGSMTTDKKIDGKFEVLGRLIVKTLRTLRIISYVNEYSLKANTYSRYGSTATKIVEINFDAETDTPTKVRRLMITLYKTMTALYKKVFRSTGKINVIKVGKGDMTSYDTPYITEKTVRDWETINNIDEQVNAFCFFNEDYAKDAALYWIRNLKDALDSKDAYSKIKTGVCKFAIDDIHMVKKVDTVDYREGTVYLNIAGPVKIHSAAYVLRKIKEGLEWAGKYQIDRKISEDTEFRIDNITKLTFDMSSILNDRTEKLDFSWVREFLDNYVGENVQEIIINQNVYAGENWWFNKKYENKVIDLTKELKGYKVTWKCSMRQITNDFKNASNKPTDKFKRKERTEHIFKIKTFEGLVEIKQTITDYYYY